MKTCLLILLFSASAFAGREVTFSGVLTQRFVQDRVAVFMAVTNVGSVPQNVRVTGTLRAASTSPAGLVKGDDLLGSIAFQPGSVGAAAMSAPASDGYLLIAPGKSAAWVTGGSGTAISVLSGSIQVKENSGAVRAVATNHTRFDCDSNAEPCPPNTAPNRDTVVPAGNISINSDRPF